LLDLLSKQNKPAEKEMPQKMTRIPRGLKNHTEYFLKNSVCFFDPRSNHALIFSILWDFFFCGRKMIQIRMTEFMNLLKF